MWLSKAQLRLGNMCPSPVKVYILMVFGVAINHDTWIN